MAASGSAVAPPPPTPRVIERQDPVGDDLIAVILAEIAEDELLSGLVGVDVGPAAPDASHAVVVLPALAEWLRRAEEVHEFLEATRTPRPGPR